MGTKEQKTAVWMLIFMTAEIIALIITFFYVENITNLKVTCNYCEEYQYNLETVITKYNEEKEEEAVVTITGENRKGILEMLSNASGHWRYDGNKFNYNYKLAVQDDVVYYLDVDEKILKKDDFYELTEEECSVITALFDESSENGESKDEK